MLCAMINLRRLREAIVVHDVGDDGVSGVIDAAAIAQCERPVVAGALKGFPEAVGSLVCGFGVHWGQGWG